MRTLAAVLVAVTMFAAPSDDQLPPGHPPVTTPPVSPALPAGHPPLPVTPAAPLLHGGRADIASAIAAYYDSISGPPGAPRDWARFESLFRPNARLVTVTTGGGADRIVELSPAQFAAMNGSYFERGGYFEHEVSERTVVFGRVAHVWSTYESRRRAGDPPYVRGVNSFQLVSVDGRWWITGVAWDRERPGVFIPPAYLPATSAP